MLFRSKNEEINDIDGVKIDFPDKWVHLRKSNTEPIIRVYSEAATPEAAEEIGQQIMKVIEDLLNKAERNVIMNVPLSREREVGLFLNLPMHSSIKLLL